MSCICRALCMANIFNIFLPAKHKSVGRARGLSTNLTYKEQGSGEFLHRMIIQNEKTNKNSNKPTRPVVKILMLDFGIFFPCPIRFLE